jgi:hypothetical protein
MSVKNKVIINGVTINKSLFVGKSDAEVKDLVNKQDVFEHLTAEQKTAAVNQLPQALKESYAKDAEDAAKEDAKNNPAPAAKAVVITPGK